MTDTMGKIRKIKKLIGKDRMMRFLNCLRFIPDRPYLKLEYRFLTGKKLNLDNPESFNEKLQYLKLYDRKNIYTQMADKLRMRDFVKERTGEDCTVPLLGVWSNPGDIDFDKLPDCFVLKCNHDSKGLVICRDKRELDRNLAVKQLSGSMKRNMFWAAREWPYRNIEPKVFAEKLLSDISEYQVMCFNGEPKFLYYMSDDKDGHLTENFFDMDFKPLDDISMGYGKSDMIVEKPALLSRMKDISRLLSDGCPHLRVDFLISEGKLYVGELTFYNDAGFAPIKPDDWNLKMGGWIELPERHSI